MDELYAEAISSFAYDLNNLWKDKNKFKTACRPPTVPVQDEDKLELNLIRTACRSPTVPVQDEDKYSLKRFLFSANSQQVGSPKPKDKPKPLTGVDRLIKSAPIWTRTELSRVEVDNILQKYEKGVFIVRTASDKKTIVLSYRADKNVQHLIIKVDLKNECFVQGSANVFINVNMLIWHYMTNFIQTPDILLTLPKALREAYDVTHLNFFENLKLDFWNTSVANKSIKEIWPDAVDESETPQPVKLKWEVCPPLPPRGYNWNHLLIIQGLADITESDLLPDVKCQMCCKRFRGKIIDGGKYLPKEESRMTGQYICNICRDKLVEKNSAQVKYSDLDFT